MTFLISHLFLILFCVYYVVMRLVYLFVLFCCFFACSKSPPDLSEVFIVQYPMGDAEYGVLIVQKDDKLSLSELKRVARQTAATVCRKHGYRYFSIESEHMVELTRSSDSEKGLGTPQNLY